MRSSAGQWGSEIVLAILAIGAFRIKEKVYVFFFFFVVD